MTKRETSFDKGLQILRLLAQSRDGIRISDISATLGYPESTVVRLLQTLKDFDLASQDRPRGPYALSYGVLDLAGHMLDGMELRQVARPFLHDLAARTTMAAYLKIPSITSVVTVDAAIPPRAWVPDFEIGRRYPMHRSSLGQAMLAARGDAAIREYLQAVDASENGEEPLEDVARFLRQVKRAQERGYAVNQTGPGGQDSVAAAIRRFDGEVVGAVGVGFRHDSGVIGTPVEQQVSHEVVTTARSISFAVGYRADRLI